MSGWMELFESIEGCLRCPLYTGRNLCVPGEGNPYAKLMFVGEGPGAQEDRLGRPFVGQSGQLLTGMIAAIGLQRKDVYIANIVKCRPPGNRAPTPDEAAGCMPYLNAQIALVKPRIIVSLGATAGKYMLGDDVRVRRDHGKWVEKDDCFMMVTFHPSALLRDPTQKRDAWHDFLLIKEKLSSLEG